MGDARKSRNPPRAARGFTLVELVVVIGIIATLMALIYSAVLGIQNQVARKNTIIIMEAIDAGLKEYYRDWGKYPCTSTPAPPGAYEAVDTSKEPFSIVSGISDADQKQAAILYLAMTLHRRRGPYMKPGESTIELKLSAGTVYVYADGWGRMIKYKISEDSLHTKPPILESDGANEFDPADDVKNYQE